VPLCPPQVPNIRSEVWKTIQVGYGKAKEVLAYNDMLEIKGFNHLKS
jgi:hypothetical protein